MNLFYFFIIFLNNIYYPKNLHISKNEIIPNTLKYSDILYFIKLWFCKEYIFIFKILHEYYFLIFFFDYNIRCKFILYYIMSGLENILDGSINSNDFDDTLEKLRYTGQSYYFSTKNMKILNILKYPITKMINNFFIIHIIADLIELPVYFDKYCNSSSFEYFSYYLNYCSFIFCFYLFIRRIYSINILKLFKFIILFVLDNTISYTITKCKYFSVRNIVLNFHFNRDNFNIKSNNFCDIFLRTYKKIVVDESHFVSPVDGLLIQSSNIQNNCILINKQMIDVKKILNKNITLTDDYFYSIYYLTYKDYHYVHSPFDCNIIDFFVIDGSYHWMENSIEFGCKFLGNNYRHVFQIVDVNGNECFLIMIASIIAGTIVHDINIPANIKKGDMIAHFDIGSMVIFISKHEMNSAFSLHKRVSVCKTII